MAAVRSADEDSGPSPRRRQQKHIRRQTDAITHRDAQVQQISRSGFAGSLRVEGLGTEAECGSAFEKRAIHADGGLGLLPNKAVPTLTMVAPS
jgi:hypothetical protein